MRLLYTFGVRFYAFLIRVASIWNPKAKEWIRGRKNWKESLPNYSTSAESIYWFHCASLGEFEQGLPVMQELRKMPNVKILVSFFSPSGYRFKKDHPISDFTFYLPIDTAKNSDFLIKRLNPKAIIFIKYEFWGNLILEANKKSIQLYSISAVFRPNQIFFRFYGGFMRKILEKFNQIFVQNASSQELLKSINIEAIVSGDTRFDRVLQNSINPKIYPEIESWIDHNPVLVCGSVWKEDLDVISEKVNELSKEWKIIIAPHNIDSKSVQLVHSYFKNSILYTDISSSADQKILIIDNIGILQHLYQFGKLAYVGGGFRTGLHNILEPSAFGLPVVFGNNYDKFPEAFLFIESGIGFSVENSKEFASITDQLINADLSDKVSQFMVANSGAVTKILSEIIKE